MENYEFAAAFDYTDEDDPNNNCVTVDTNGLDIIYAVMYRASRGDGDNSGHEDLRDSTHAVAQVIAEEYIFDNYLYEHCNAHNCKHEVCKGCDSRRSWRSSNRQGLLPTECD